MVVTYQLRDGVGLYQRSSSAPNPNPYVPRMGETVLLLPSVREPGTQERRYTVHEVITVPNLTEDRITVVLDPQG